MDFSKIKDLYIGGVPAQYAYLNGHKIWERINVKSIMDSIVLWYDIKRQGATNENMAAIPVLRDLSGNGHDATCYNFAWGGMSGIGYYPFLDNNWTIYRSTVERNNNVITFKSINEVHAGENTYIAYYWPYGHGLLTGTYKVPHINLTIDNPNNLHLQVGIISDTDKYADFSDSRTIDIPEETYELDNKQLGIRISYLDVEPNPDANITITVNADYPDAIVSDGVDDYAQVTGLPILTKERGYTVVAKRTYIDLVDSMSSLATKRDSNNSYNGAFQFETSWDISFSFGGATGEINIQTNEAVVYQTSKSYNGQTSLNIGDSEDSDSLLLFSFITKTISKQAALYSLLLFDRDLTEQEIEWVKTNMIEYKDVTEEWYGVEFYTTSPYPDCIRIGNMELHKTLPVHIQMKGCLLSDDGVVNKYLNETDWTSETRDGSQGQVMVEMPKDSYWKFETEGNIRRVKFSTKPLPGFTKTPQGYVSAYEATVQRSVNKLASVVNTTAEYRGCNNQADRDGTYRSALGMPATLISRINFRNYARNRKADSTAWNCYVYDMHKLLYWLFVVEYATLNSQKAYNSALTEDGYRQGGLGYGVTTLDWERWSNFNGNYPFIPCGYTDSLGNGTGVVEYSMPTEYEASVKKVSVPRYRGIENPFGHLWKWTDGINVRISPNEPDGDGLSKVYVCSDPSKFNDTNYDGYTYVGDEARNEQYVKEVIFGEGGEIIPSVRQNASNETYFCDFHYTSIPNNETLRGLLLGASANLWENAGFVVARSSYVPSDSAAFIGSRLCFIPA